MNVTNGTFISTSIKIGIIIQSVTINNKEKQKEINEIEGNNNYSWNSSYMIRSFQIILYNRNRIMFQYVHLTH